MELIPSIEEDGVNLYAWVLYMPVFSQLSRESGTGFSSIVELSKGHGRWSTQRDEYRKYAEWTAAKFRDDQEFFDRTFENSFKAIEEMQAFSDGVLGRDYSKATDEGLLEAIAAHRRHIEKVFYWALPAIAPEAPYALVTHALQDWLRANEARLGMPAGRAFEILTHESAESAAERESAALAGIAAQVPKALANNISSNPTKAWEIIQQDAKLAGLAGKLEKHAAEFCWAYYNYDGPAWDARKFAEALAVGLRDGAVPRPRNGHEGQRRALEKKLGMDEGTARLFGFARKAVVLKCRRKDAMFKAFYALEKVQKEIAKRAGLTLRQERFLMPDEISAALEGKADADQLNERSEFCVVAQSPEGISLLEGRQAREAAGQVVEHKATGLETELHGQCACAGEATGTVRIVNVPGDLGKMKKGDVLVSVSTTPDLVTGMRKAAAIVTDLGGMTSHAAIVSREMGTPCVVGTKIATKALKDGDVVEVDATNGIVRITKKAT